ncbi:CBS domain-containing protein [Facilibium subflavum]|uniref:CBS domain-containing protein n=1 Tax=Facilibium subflavum TaxID=2219058 RepID=UPI000E659DE2|nr:CBS domain-containing protein [Facilibium subflavum]
MMFKEYKLLPTHTENKPVLPYFHPDTMDVISLETPALDVLADFHTKRPRIIHKDARADDALAQMQKEQVRALLVINDEDQVVGLINAARVQGIYRTQIARQHDIHTKDVTVNMLMAASDILPLLDYNAVKDACVGHIARLLHEKKIDHILVYETNAKHKLVIRGIFSASFISRRLGMPIGRDLSSGSLAEMNKII